MLACGGGHSVCVRLLLESGAHLLVADTAGLSALHYAGGCRTWGAVLHGRWCMNGPRHGVHLGARDGERACGGDADGFINGNEATL